MAVPSGGRAIQASTLSHTIFREFHKIFSLGLRPLSHTLKMRNFFARVVGCGEWGWQPKTTSPAGVRMAGAGRRPVLRVSTIAETFIALALVALAMIADSIGCGSDQSHSCAWVRVRVRDELGDDGPPPPSPKTQNHSPKPRSRANKNLHGARPLCMMVSVGSRQSRRAT